MPRHPLCDKLTPILYATDKLRSDGTTDPLVMGIVAVVALYIIYRIVKFLFFRKKRV